MHGIECDIGNKKCWADFKYGANDWQLNTRITEMINGIIEVYEDDDAVYDLDQWTVDNAIDYVVQNIKADLATGQAILEKYKELTRSAFEEAANDSKAITKDVEIEMKSGSIDELYFF